MKAFLVLGALLLGLVTVGCSSSDEVFCNNTADCDVSRNICDGGQIPFCDTSDNICRCTGGTGGSGGASGG
jgi:hypothetical protein